MITIKADKKTKKKLKEEDKKLTYEILKELNIGDTLSNEEDIEKEEVKVNHKKILFLRKEFVYLFLVLFVIFGGYSGARILLWSNDARSTEKQIEKINNEVNVEEVKDTSETIIVNPPKEEEVQRENPYRDYIKMNLINVDFSKLKSAGVEFVIIRIGSSTGINGENFIDSKFIQNIKNANSVGIPVGVYFYSYANSVDRAISDAKWIIENIKDYKVELPIAFDWENWGSFNTYELSFFGLTNMAKRFMDTVKDAGYDAMLYSSKTYLENIWMSVDYPVWLAHYTKNTNYAGDYSYWQICSNGRVDGINGDVDIDIRYID